MAGETKDHLIGLLLGAEEDWPQAFEQILRFVGPLEADGTTHHLASERLTIEPFDLVDPVRTGLVIDRLAHWYFHPREWLKKAALVNGTYLLNSPFTFQSMEKHSAYCAMLRLGLHVPKTILVPYKNPVDNHRWTYTSAKYNEPFDLDVLAEEIGYPLYMKPFDGGGWRGVSRVDGPDDLHRAYDESGEMLMHLQATVEFDHFARALSIGPGDDGDGLPARRADAQPLRRHARLPDAVGRQAGGRDLADRERLLPLGVQLLRDAGQGRRRPPDRLRERVPRRRGHLLHYYFPWAITALVRWSTYCLVTGRRPNHDLEMDEYFAVADSDRTYDEKLDAYLALADAHFETERYRDWCTSHLGHLDALVAEWVSGADFDRLLVETVQATYPRQEQEKFLAHFRGLVGLWVQDQSQTSRPRFRHENVVNLGF